ncbi:MAG: hypothetical protein HYT63_00715 [Candidatus Yanofskybacteria bacterium]|nr:hypothetical protein [Candidatus Yanofskybacteria bacterium]
MMEKRRQVEEVLMDIYGKCLSMSVLEVLLGLRDLHEFYKLPVWLQDTEGRNILSNIINQMALNSKKAGFSIVENNFLADMLLWPELQEYNDNRPRFAILHVLEKSSFRAIFSALVQHMEFLSSAYSREAAGTHRNAALGEELEMTRKLIQKCGGAEELIAENMLKVEKKKAKRKAAEIPLFPPEYF